MKQYEFFLGVTSQIDSAPKELCFSRVSALDAGLSEENSLPL
jgi:hypothetical protein